MGTRNLTCVVLNGEYKVAQYCQWDGYPTGQGDTVAKFIQNISLRKFKANVKKCSFVSVETIQEAWQECETECPKSPNEAFKLKYPAFHRDTGADILNLIQSGLVSKLQDQVDFAADSLFCEWAYVIDLDKKTVEVYKGFNQTKLKRGERFAKLKGSNGYHPVKLLATYTFKQFTVDAMKQLEEKLNAEEGE